ncbi:MAG: hypothetical protein MZV63_65430 [Marinilabiliales bacterium]|nr:hypothetical protein [Marinilabiliales bacterium]
MRAKIAIVGLTVLLAACVACDREDEAEGEDDAMTVTPARQGTDLDGQARRLSARPGPPQLDRRRRFGLPPPDHRRGSRPSRPARTTSPCSPRSSRPWTGPGTSARRSGSTRSWASSPRTSRRERTRPGGGWTRRSRAGALGPFSTRTSSPGSTRPGGPSRSSWSRRPWPCPTRRSSWSSTAATGPRRTRPRCARR